MSTSRWVIETPCETCGGSGLEPCYEPQPCGGEPCRSCHQMGVKRVVVDPDNLPPEAIQRAAVALSIAVCGVDESDDVGCMDDHRSDAEAAVRAFLSDPEPGDQT